MLFYRAALPLSSRTLTFVSGLIRRHRKSIGSRWRKLNPGQQALLVLAYLRKGETFAELAAGFAVGTTTQHQGLRCLSISGVLPLRWFVCVFVPVSCLRAGMARVRVSLRAGVRFHGPRPRDGGAACLLPVAGTGTMAR